MKKVERLHRTATFLRSFYGEQDVIWGRVSIYGRRRASATPNFFATARRYYLKDVSTCRGRNFMRGSATTWYYKLRGFAFVNRLDRINEVGFDFVIQAEPNVQYTAKDTNGNCRINVIQKTIAPWSSCPKQSEIVILPNQTSPQSTGNIVVRLAEAKQALWHEGTGKMPCLHDTIDTDKTAKMKPLEFKTKIS